MASPELQWRPIDTCPKKDEEAVILSDGGQVAVAEWAAWGGLTHGGHWDFYGAEYDFEPTYWMPLPGPPTSQAKPEAE